jgi:hypothetical protein
VKRICASFLWIWIIPSSDKLNRTGLFLLSKEQLQSTDIIKLMVLLTFFRSDFFHCCKYKIEVTKLRHFLCENITLFLAVDAYFIYSSLSGYHSVYFGDFSSVLRKSYIPVLLHSNAIPKHLLPTKQIYQVTFDHQI